MVGRADRGEAERDDPVSARPIRGLDRPCQRCGKRHLAVFVWLELDSATNLYHEPGAVAIRRSQGLFPFGVQCAKAELAITAVLAITGAVRA